MATGKKFYWLKLSKDFFKRHDIQIIEGMENGKDYILFYLKLLVESISHEGELRFSETVPYDEKMLSTITNTNIDVVRSAIKLFIQLNLMSIYDDKTIYMEETTKMLGYETDWAKQKREQRKQLSADTVHLLSADSPQQVHQEIDIELDIEKDKEIHSGEKKKNKAFIAPTLQEIIKYYKEKGFKNFDPKVFFNYFDTGKWIDSKGNKVKNWKQKMITWESKNNNQKQPEKPKAAPGSEYDMSKYDEKVIRIGDDDE